VEALLGRLPPPQQQRVVDAMGTITGLLGEGRTDPGRGEPYLLRTHAAGDMGWVIHRHALLYAKEWGYNAEFEALAARICADFLDHFDPSGERCWIAERNREIVGSVFLVRKSKTVAKLRLLLVEPAARGLGIGRRLIEECIRFARQAGYRKMTLWTQSDLDAARHLYREAGFRCVHRKRHDSFGRKNLVAETWELKL
jgi:GNAT superfamily N-acetyltransferase